MHCSLTVDQKHVSIRFISLCILSVPLASSIIFGIEHSYLTNICGRKERRGREGGRGRKAGKVFPIFGNVS